MRSFLDVIRLWPTTGELARDLGIGTDTVSQWQRRSSIPPTRWRSVMAAARKRRYAVPTIEDMLAMHEKQITAQDPRR